MRRWFFPRDLTLSLGWALMEALVVSAPITVVTATLPTSLALTSTSVIAPMVLAALLGRASTLFDARRRLMLPTLLALAAVLACAWVHQVIAVDAAWTPAAWFSLLTAPAIGTPSLLVAWALALGLTGRGLLIGLDEPEHGRVLKSFLSGASILPFMLVLLEVAAIALPTDASERLRTLVIAYFFVGALVTALAQRRSVRRASGGRAEVTLSWLFAVVVPIAGVFALVSILPGGSNGARVVLMQALALLTWLAQALVGAATWIVQVAVSVLRWVGELLSDGHRQPTAPPSWELSEPPLGPDAAPLRSLHVDDSDVLPWLLPVLLLLFGMLFVGVLRRTLQTRPKVLDDDEERASLWSWRLLYAQLRALARALGARAKGLGASIGDRASARASRARDARLEDMRAIYRALIRWAEEQGVPRAESATPLEHAARIARALPAADAHVAAITAHYLEVRYGGAILDDQQLAHARAHVRALVTDLARDA